MYAMTNIFDVAMSVKQILVVLTRNKWMNEWMNVSLIVCCFYLVLWLFYFACVAVCMSNFFPPKCLPSHEYIKSVALSQLWLTFDRKKGSEKQKDRHR